MVEWKEGGVIAAVIRGRKVRVEVYGGWVSWKVGSAPVGDDSASGCASDLESAKKMAILVAEAMPDLPSSDA